MLPTQSIIDKAMIKAKSMFTTEILPCTKINSKSFVVTIINIRGEMKHVIDYTFLTKTGRLLYCKTIESKYI